MARVTLQTIADRVGVSRMTVSNAFSRPDQLSADLREQILLAAEELGYVGPDPAARALARGTAGAVGVLLTDSLQYAFTDQVAATFLGAIADELAPTGLALTLLTSTPAAAQPSSAGSIAGGIPARDVPLDGAFVYSCEVDSPGVEWLKRRKLPMVFIDQAPESRISSVNVDDRAGARAAAQHLVDLGHRRIAIATSAFAGANGIVPRAAAEREGYVQRQRMIGWHEPLELAGITPVVYQEVHTDDEQGLGAARTLLQLVDRPTAILCFSDVIAYGVVQVANDLGLRVPEDLSVVGFDDNPLAQRMRPALTTVRQDVAAKGRAAAAALTVAIEQARSGAIGRATHLLIPTDLVVRDSTAAPASARGRAKASSTRSGPSSDRR